MMSPTLKSLTVLPFLKNTFEVAWEHLLTTGIKAIFVFRYYSYFYPLGSPRLPEHLTQLSCPPLYCEQVWSACPPWLLTRRGLQAWALAQRKSSLPPARPHLLINRQSSCNLPFLQFLWGPCAPGQMPAPLPWRVVMSPPRERLICKVLMAKNWGEVLIQKPSFDQGGALHLRGNLSCLQTSGAFEKPWQVMGQASQLLRKGANRMRPGWKLHIIGTQKGRKQQQKRELLIKSIIGKVHVRQEGDNGIKICLQVLYVFVIIQPLAYLSFSGSPLWRNLISFPLHGDSVLSLFGEKTIKLHSFYYY